MRWIAELFIALDIFLINLFEKFTRRLQILTGKTNFFFANVCLAAIIGLTLSRDIFIFEFRMDDPSVIFSCIIMILISSYEEKMRLKLIFKGIANSRKVNSPAISIRFFFLVIFILAAIENQYCAWNFGFLLMNQYLMACDPLPPCQSKIEEWIKILFYSGREMITARVKS